MEEVEGLRLIALRCRVQAIQPVPVGDLPVGSFLNEHLADFQIPVERGVVDGRKLLFVRHVDPRSDDIRLHALILSSQFALGILKQPSKHETLVLERRNAKQRVALLVLYLPHLDALGRLRDLFLQLCEHLLLFAEPLPLKIVQLLHRASSRLGQTLHASGLALMLREPLDECILVNLQFHHGILGWIRHRADKLLALGSEGEDLSALVVVHRLLQQAVLIDKALLLAGRE